MKSFTLALVCSLLLFSNVFSQNEVLSLEDCIQIALENNSELKISKFQNESADEAVLGSYSYILPSIGASAGYSKNEYGPVTVERDVPISFDPQTGQWVYQRQKIRQNGYTTEFNSMGIQWNQNIYDGGNWWNSISQAKSQKLASDFSLKSTENMVILNVQQYYFDLLKHQKLLEVNELAVQRSEDQLNKTQKMFELGSVAKVDVYRSKVNLGNDKIQLLTQENTVIAAKNILNLVLGREPGTPIYIESDNQLKTGFGNLDDLIADALANNPTLKMYNQNINTQEYGINRMESSYYPNLSGSVSYGRGNESFDKVYSNFNENWNLSYRLNLSINLFNGFNDKVNVQQSKLQLKNDKETLVSNERSVKSSIMQFLDNYESYLEIIEINKENLEAAKEEYRLAEERYRIGSGTQLELREGQVNLTRAEQTLVAAQYNARIVQAQIEEKIGTIYQN